MPVVWSVRRAIEAYARGTITESETERLLLDASWELTPSPSMAELNGLVDTPPPPDNSPDWIQLVPGIAPATRRRFTAAYDRR